MAKQIGEKTDAQVKEQARRQAEAAKRTLKAQKAKPATQATPNPALNEDNGGKSKPKSVKK